MSGHNSTQHHNPHKVPKKPIFIIWFFVYLYKKLGLLSFPVRVITISIMAVTAFIFEFPIPKEILAFMTPPVIIFLVGQYLTLLPTLLCVLLIFIPVTQVRPILATSVFFSFFMVFLI